ncbi:Golgi resident GCP60 [Paramuricea clavata]|uniref:Golgi resident GCP60 n=1 Tax=Paramuricea clavata TaxID=317549 RepID=A0A6S7JCY0_PARCT|nr:Golgi resident GCP60 [Paramuricea clavata]
MANLTITDDDSVLSDSINHDESQDVYKKCFTLRDYYKQCLSFYHKGKDVIKITYQDKIRLTALWKQASVGKYDPSKIPEVGYFDVVGNDRKIAWEGLGDMAKEKAMEEFCSLVEKIAPELEAYLEAQCREIEENRRKKLEEERRKREEEEQRRREEEERLERERLLKIEEQKRREEAEREEQRKKEESLKAEQERTSLIQAKPQVNGSPSIAPASLWSRPKVQEFIQHVRTDPGSVLVVGRGETITVRVPTHENGTCLFWEFATETYDVGFGVSFEWTLPSSEAITVEVHEDEDGETVQDGEHDETQKQRIDEILPTIRRPCNEEVMVGSHLYPGRGVYLLKFDNSYSLFRSKTLFYRVYYTR